MILFGAAYYPEHRDRDKWEYDLDMMASARVNCLRVGEFAWTRFEPEDGLYDFGWMDDFSALAARRGITLLVCPPMRTIPAWLMAQDPGLAILRDDGVRLAYGSRYSFCVNHPLLLGKCEALTTRMAAHYAKDPNVIGWHLDNEPGDEPDCHCDICRRKFQDWCGRRYGTIGEVNKAWGTVFWGLEFADFSQIPTPAATKAVHGPGHLLAWRRFRAESVESHIAMQAECVRKIGRPDQFVTTNYQGIGRATMDQFEASSLLDVCGTIYYPELGADANPHAGGEGLTLAVTRAFRQQTFQLHELRNGAHMIPGKAGNTPCPGETEKLTMHCVANGADAIFYFRWRACPFGAEQSHGTITDYDGRPKRIFAEVRRTGERLERLSSLIEGTSVMSEIAVLLDYPTIWTMETGVHWNGPKGMYREQLKAVYRGVRREPLNCNFAGRGQDWSGFKVLIVPFLASMDDSLAEKICDYVEQGGLLVWHPFCGMKTPESAIYPDRLHPRLKQMLGVDITEFATVGEKGFIPFTWRGQSWQGKYFCDLPVLTGATSSGEFTDTWFAGTPAVAERKAGKGNILYVMTFGTEDFYAALCKSFCAEGKLKRILDTTIPPGVEIVERSAMDGRRLVFLTNSGGTTETFDLPEPLEDVYNQEHVGGNVVIPPYGVRVLRV